MSFLMGMIFFAWYNNFIIITTTRINDASSLSSSLIQKKEVIHFYFHNDKWKTEKQEILWTNNVIKNIMHLINAWLTLLDEESITIKKITLQSALLSVAGTLYLSFDHQILIKDDTIFKKWMMIEGILKTLKENNIVIQNVHFLIQHQRLNDPHLDFSESWPIHGFM